MNPQGSHPVGVSWKRVFDAFPGLDPDVPLRYRPILERLPREGRILEIGRGEVGLAHLRGGPMVTCDIVTPAARAPGEDFVRATGTRLPFRDHSFDWVVAVDVLEHLPRPLRANLVAEASRVARGGIVFACPCRGSARAESGHRRLLVALRGHSNPWLEEHRECGFPAEEEILAAVPPAWRATTAPNVNLAVWRLNRALVDVAFRSLRPLAYLGDILDFGRTYRTVFVLRPVA
ncbi:MAG TPA: methyltransferase domain-containing protein [Thermoplasmata archaeon]|nr:methyltransferase domain-containing protein [Thermoplasmata archaeon]